jgi:Domain of unknown function (DUF3597)
VVYGVPLKKLFALRWGLARQEVDRADKQVEETPRSTFIPSAYNPKRSAAMSIFGDIMSAIFGRSASAAPSGSMAPSGLGAGASAPQQPMPSVTITAKPASQAQVDVAAVLDGLAKQKKQKLNWRTSIVDLMKLLDLDSSAAARKHLAEELHYRGDMKGSAKMNIWLHKQVMIKLAENGGKVPDELKR